MSEAPAAATASTPPAAPAKDKTTEYVVLYSRTVTTIGEEGEDAVKTSAWFVGRTISARTPKKAIEAHMKAESLTAGEFVAVPKRHWTIEKPTTVTTERLAF